MSVPSQQQTRYIPAAGRRSLTPCYDAVVAMTMRERQWRPALVGRLLERVPPDGRVVDVGSGTGTLAIELARRRPDVEVIGIDGDQEVLDRATRKPDAAAVRWRRGLASELPVEADSVDAVVMTLLLHHLDASGKHEALTEARRVLRPGGHLHIADWGRASGPVMRLAFLALQVIDGFPGTRAHAAGRLPALVEAAGFGDLERYRRLRTGWGTLELIDAAALR